VQIESPKRPTRCTNAINAILLHYLIDRP
jgi:hypothetical protein